MAFRQSESTITNSAKEAARFMIDSVGDEAPVLWLMIGVIGSGKTTLSREMWNLSRRPLIRICLDDIIQMLSFYSYDKEMELLYSDMEKLPMIKGLTSGCSVILDRTNLTREIREQFLSIGRKLKAMAGDLLDTGIESPDTAPEALFEKKIELLVEEKQAVYMGRSDYIYADAFRELMKKRASEKVSGKLFPEEDEPGIKSDLFSHLESIVRMPTVAVFFDQDPVKCLERRKRDTEIKKRNTVRQVDWDAVMKEMLGVLEFPRIEEGFDTIFRIKEGWKVERLA